MSVQLIKRCCREWMSFMNSSLTGECSIQCNDLGVAFAMAEGNTLAKRGHTNDDALRCVSDERSCPSCSERHQAASLIQLADAVACCIESADLGGNRKGTSLT